MQKLLCVCASPCTDRYLYADTLCPGGEFAAYDRGVCIGGKGVNVACALAAYGNLPELLLILPENDYKKYETILEKRGIIYNTVLSNGFLRENITVTEQNGRETRFIGQSSPAGNAAEPFVSKILLCDADTVILSGSVQSDARDRVFAALAECGKHIIIDSRSAGIGDIGMIKPLLVKPNAAEAYALSGVEATDEKSALSAASVIAAHGAQNVLVSLGRKGAVLLSDSGKGYYCRAAEISAKSTVGAGDAMVAGFASAYANGFDAEICLETAVAFSAAACVSERTEPPAKADIERFRKEIRAVKI